ncbi:hypothetical protein C8J57DRAFT_1242869 [Mycena rebaudengoi]|nr:hypothetical protein C8J57DRAFT_1242869 [Mycena rebaudengoi]
MQTSPLQLHMTLESGSEFYYPNFDKTHSYSGLSAEQCRHGHLFHPWSWLSRTRTDDLGRRRSVPAADDLSGFSASYMAVEAPPNRRATSLKSVFRVPHQSTTSYASSGVESFEGGPVWGGAPDESVLGCKVAYHSKDRAK